MQSAASVACYISYRLGLTSNLRFRMLTTNTNLPDASGGDARALLTQIASECHCEYVSWPVWILNCWSIAPTLGDTMDTTTLPEEKKLSSFRPPGEEDYTVQSLLNSVQFQLKHKKEQKISSRHPVLNSPPPHSLLYEPFPKLLSTNTNKPSMS